MGTSSDKAELFALLKKYRAGQCTPEEIAQVEAWLDSFEELPDNDAMTAAANEVVVNVMHSLFPPKGKLRYILYAAAALVVLALTGLLFLFRFNTKTPVAVTYAAISTGKGERKNVTLPDGSQLTLNAASSVIIPSDFGQERRELTLSGQGTFDIRQNIKQPFIVHTGSLRTVVLGTVFDIKAYPGDAALQVAVLSGKVRVEKQQQQHTEILATGIEKDQLLTYNAGTGKHELKPCNAEDIAGWQQNKLFFDQATIAEIAQVLERQYNIHIMLTGTARRQCRYTLQLKNEPLNKALLLLEQLSGISYQVNNNEIKINIASCE
ncbi:FecR family protein [Chitinophaga pinensis]|uniref:Anti-FecI sigma factor, FecR n=1 Tax=Chitinophaga pinensis (strain ATCC 43595 / DSM 2588 / LMG 13176 / NBRC 15968 / NCIMB 11800 / UQM 2034) TaxID=485918 RepID=A0A979G5B6_CHIPD|nr:FecR family protein [Chitinophaga pinensis]ACU61094.1 anti-FecI sigma factor, FecR [Chitinophaga pinensis DSM 2588]